MAWVMDTYSMHMRHTTTAVVTGKPLALGGSRGRKEATGRGLMIVCDCAIAKLGMKREQTRVIVQGFGNVGSMGAMLMHEAGYKIVGVADIHGALYYEKGFDIPKLIDWCYTQRKPLAGISRWRTKMSAQEVLFQPCDIVVPVPLRIRSPRRTQIACRPASSAKAPMAPPPPRPMRLLIARESSSSRTFWPTPAA